ncbi:MAG: hypothetical protein HOO86_05270 [Bacteroidales bacterium]|nr:hypothetical protein [Bacteroidales bacterium]
MRYLLIFIVLLLFACKPGRVPDQLMPARIAGLWKSEGNLVFYEQWDILPDSSLSGRGFSINGTDTLVLENLRIAKLNDTLYYFATVYKQNKGIEIPFKLVHSAGNRWVFENAKHDYPNRIIYQLESDTVLFARTENIRGNKPVEFHFKRLK